MREYSVTSGNIVVITLGESQPFLCLLSAENKFSMPAMANRRTSLEPGLAESVKAGFLWGQCWLWQGNLPGCVMRGINSGQDMQP